MVNIINRVTKVTPKDLFNLYLENQREAYSYIEDLEGRVNIYPRATNMYDNVYGAMHIYSFLDSDDDHSDPKGDFLKLLFSLGMDYGHLKRYVTPCPDLLDIYSEPPVLFTLIRKVTGTLIIEKKVVLVVGLLDEDSNVPLIYDFETGMTSAYQGDVYALPTVEDIYYVTHTKGVDSDGLIEAPRGDNWFISGDGGGFDFCTVCEVSP